MANTRSASKTNLLVDKTLWIFFLLDRHCLSRWTITRRRSGIGTFAVTMRCRCKWRTCHCIRCSCCAPPWQQANIVRCRLAWNAISSCNLGQGEWLADNVVVTVSKFLLWRADRTCESSVRTNPHGHQSWILHWRRGHWRKITRHIWLMECNKRIQLQWVDWRWRIVL